MLGVFATIDFNFSIREVKLNRFASTD